MIVPDTNGFWESRPKLAPCHALSFGPSLGGLYTEYKYMICPFSGMKSAAMEAQVKSTSPPAGTYRAAQPNRFHHNTTYQEQKRIIPSFSPPQKEHGVTIERTSGRTHGQTRLEQTAKEEEHRCFSFFFFFVRPRLIHAATGSVFRRRVFFPSTCQLSVCTTPPLPQSTTPRDRSSKICRSRQSASPFIFSCYF